VIRGAALAVGVAAAGCSTSGPPTAAQLGARLFADPDLSSPSGQACADCHTAEVAFRDPESSHSSSMGVVPGRFGKRNSQSAMYAQFSPPLHYDPVKRGWYGGLFWDGRASSLADQAERPLLEPLEMNNPDKATVVASVRKASYAPMFREVFGPGALDDVDRGFARIAEAIAAFEITEPFAPFSSKYDRFLAGREPLSPAEQRGLAIFEDPKRGNCAGCHPSRPGPDGAPPLFTTFGYANLGIPKYGNNMFLLQPKAFNPDGHDFIDHGLMTTVGDPEQDGKFRIPSLRNVARTPPYGHNGYFANLQYMVDFLVTRDGVSADPAVGAWPGPEVAATVDRRVGDLGLSPQDIDDLVAFLETLTDEEPGAAP
jgi:cytochrome c peroxidase